MIRRFRYIVLIFVLIYMVRLFGINLFLFGDEVEWVKGIESPSLETAIFFIPHPPVPMLIYRSFHFIGFSGESLRIVPFIFTGLTIILLFFLCRKLYGERSARICVLLLLLSFYSLLMSLQIDSDAILVFFLVCALFFYTHENKFLLGLFFGFLLLSKITMVLVLASFFIADWFVSKSFWTAVKRNVYPFSIAAAMVSLFFALSYLLNPDWFRLLFSHPALLDWNPLPWYAPLFFLFIFATPLLLTPLLKNFVFIEKKEYVFYTLILIFFSVHIFLIRQGDFSRYFMILIPPLVLLCAKSLSSLVLNRISFYITVVLGFLCFIFLNYLPMDFPLHTTKAYSAMITSGTFSFFYSYGISSGSWFVVNFLSIVVIIIAFMLSVFIFIFFPKSTFFPLIMAFFISFNLFVAGEYLFHFSQPNPSEVANEMKEHLEGRTLNYPIIVSNKGFLYYFDQYHKVLDNQSYPLYAENIDIINREIEEQGGTILINYFALNVDPLNLNLTSCYLEKEFFSRRKKMGEIYTC